jgi:hypothetical protein
MSAHSNELSFYEEDSNDLEKRTRVENKQTYKEATFKEKMAALSLIFNPHERLKFLKLCKQAKESNDIEDMNEVCKMLEKKSWNDFYTLLTLAGISSLGIFSTPIVFATFTPKIALSIVITFGSLNISGIIIGASDLATSEIDLEARDRLQRLKFTI